MYNNYFFHLFYLKIIKKTPYNNKLRGHKLSYYLNINLRNPVNFDYFFIHK